MSSHVPIVQEADHLPRRPSLRIAFAVTVSVVLSVVIAALLLRWRYEGRVEPELRPIQVADERVGAPTRALIRTSQRGLEEKAAEQHELTGYAWVDRAQGIVSIPIEQAMRIVLERNHRAVEP